jgi:hypothetical protein
MEKNINSAKQQINIDFSKTTAVQCSTPGCENDMFMPAMKFRKVSKLLTGSKNDQLIPLQVFFCSSCGQIPKEFDVADQA